MTIIQKWALSLLLVGLVSLCLGLAFGQKIGYQEGQVDALNGKWEVEKYTETVTKYREIKP